MAETAMQSTSLPSDRSRGELLEQPRPAGRIEAAAGFRNGYAPVAQMALGAAINRSPRVAAIATMGESLNRSPHVVATRAVGDRLNKADRRASPAVVQRVVDFHGVSSTLQVLARSAVAEHPEMAGDEDFVIYFSPDAGLAEKGAAGNTEYGALIDGELHYFGPNLATVYAKTKDDRPQRLYAHITFDPKRPTLEIAAALAHEMSVHVVPFYAYRAILLGGPGKELESVKEIWKDMATSGALSEKLQHDRLGGGHVDLYAKMIKAQMSRLKNPAQQGELVFFFLGDFLSKLAAFKREYAQSVPKQAVLGKEIAWLLEELEPYEEEKSDKSALATRFDEILARIEAFSAERAETG